MKNKYKNLKWLLLAGVLNATNLYAHSLPDFESMMIMARISVNYMPKILAQNCADEDEEIQSRIKNLNSFLSKKLNLDEICDQDCVKDDNKNGLTRDQVTQMLTQFDKQTADKNEGVCNKYLSFLEEQQRIHQKPLADLVRAKHSNAPDVIYELDVVTSPVWKSNGSPNVIGQFNGRVINVKLNYRGYYHKAIETGAFDPPSKYSFLITLHRNHNDKNPLPMDITVEDVRLKVKGKYFLAKLTRSTQSGCCNSKEMLADFDYVGQIGKEPFDLEINGVNDAGFQYPPLVYKSVGKPAGLLKASRVLQELIMIQWQRG